MQEGNRRRFLEVLAGAGAVALLSNALGDRPATAATPDGPYGPLGPPGAGGPAGVQVPDGFRARVVARSLQPVGRRGHVWHMFPDGGATFPADDGGWTYVSNSETLFVAGASALRFDVAGGVVDAYPVLRGTALNCAGGATPWGTWLSCEEHPWGKVWECDPFGGPARARPHMGVFRHEAAAVDPTGRCVYLTEDEKDGLLYRFTPETWPDLGAGRLEALATTANGETAWLPVPNPRPGLLDTPTRRQVPGATRFDGGEGILMRGRKVVFTTKGDGRVWQLDPRRDRLGVLYDPGTSPDPQLHGVDNVTLSPRGDIVVAEDGGNMELVLLTRDGRTHPIVRVLGQDDSEITGPAFDPSGTRLYFSSQRGNTWGITYEVSGPFAR